MARTQYKVDLCVIGAGSGGLSVASGAAQLGRSVVLFEAAEMGGDCLNHGCVPSKALIAAGKHAQAFRAGKAFGVTPAEPTINFDTVKAHIQDVIATIAPVDSQERFEGLGCIVIREHARFEDANTVVSETVEVVAKRVVIATGSRASAPPVPGLDSVPYLTNETIFSMDKQPKRLLVMGAGPIGLELGQAFRRFGSEVAIFDIAPPLGRNEPEHAAVLVDALKAEGVEFHTPVKTKAIRKTKTGIAVDLEGGETLTGTHLLVAAGRRPVMDGLELEKAGIKYSRRGIETNDNLRTSNKKVYAVGDVSGRGGLTHAAGYHAGQIIKGFYFMPPIIDKFTAKGTSDRMPAAIYSEPELANIGLSEAQAREKFGDTVKTVHWEFDENDRAIAERSTHGAAKIITTKRGKILGASIVGEGAGELIQLVSVAMTNKVKISGLAQFISPYPSRGEIVKRAASSYYTAALFGNKAKKMAGLWTKFH